MKVIILIFLIVNVNFVFFGQLQAINIESIIDKRVEAKEMKVKREDIYFFDSTIKNEHKKKISYFYKYDSSSALLEEFGSDSDSVFYNRKYINIYNKDNQLSQTMYKRGVLDGFLGVWYFYSNTVMLAKEYKSIGSSDFIYFDSLGCDTSEVSCIDHNCNNIYTKEYEKYNLKSFVTYDFDNKVQFKKIYSYDSLDRVISSQLVLYDTLGEPFYNMLNGDLLYNYIFLPNNEIIVRKEIVYKGDSVTILYYDKENNFETLYYIFDKYKNVISKQGYNPIKAPYEVNEKRIFLYDEKGRIIQEEIYLHSKEIKRIRYTY